MAGVLKKFTRGEVIIAEGSVGTNVYIVRSGRVEVFKNSTSGALQLATLGSNEVFGEMSLIDERFSRRAASVRAIEDSEIIILDREGFENYIKGASTGISNLIKRLSSRLRETNDIISHAGLDPQNLPKAIKLTQADNGEGRLTDDQLAESVDAAVNLQLLPKKFLKGQTLIRENAEAMSLFLLRSGTVRVFKTVAGEEVEIDDLTVNEVFGEISAFDEGVRFFTVKALDDGEAVVFSKKQMDEMLRKAPLELFLILDCIVMKLKRISLRFLESLETDVLRKRDLAAKDEEILRLTREKEELTVQTEQLQDKVEQLSSQIKKLQPQQQSGN
jgi:CRP-like cAMP-binding protein